MNYVGSYNLGQKCFHVDTLEEMQRNNIGNILGALKSERPLECLWVPFVVGQRSEVDKAIDQMGKYLTNIGQKEGDPKKYYSPIKIF